MHAHTRDTQPRRTLHAWLFALLFATSASPLAAQLPPLRTTLDGVFTNEQADAGAKTYEAICSKCHGTGTGPAFKGGSFLTKWSNQSLYRLWEYMSTRMPYGAPGTLTTEQYLGMLAWILRENGYPAGTTPLPNAELNGILYEIGQINLVPVPKSASK
ncbi:MAG: cytochrome c [Gemmatimonadetes bacterium]|nr:cytochrome c [Gemmatimonadota bacterium]